MNPVVPLNLAALNGGLNPQWHPAVNPAHTYSGFLGSESTRFDLQDQHTTDIHYVDYYPPIAGLKQRQRTAAIAQGLSFASPEHRLHFQLGPDNWPINEVWARADYMIFALEFYNLGPSQPGPLAPWLHGIFEPVALAWTGGQWRLGFCIRWFHETVEWRYALGAPNLVPLPLFYHEHERRQPDEHDADLLMVKNGKRCQFDDLHFGTQIQVYRRATVEDL